MALRSPKVHQTIVLSRSILEMHDDWDGEGSPGYRQETLERAETFVRALAREFYRKYSLRLDLPEVLPSDQGSIDLHWKTDRYELLVNIPPSPGALASYYGDNTQGNMPLENQCPADQPDRKLAAWLSLFQ